MIQGLISPFRLLGSGFEHVSGSHEGAPRQDSARLGEHQSPDGATRHEGYKLRKELLSIVLPVKLFGACAC